MDQLNRRRFLGLLATAGLLRSRLVNAAGDAVRIGMTPVFLTEQTSLLRDWRAYLEQRLGRPVLFVQRDTYREIVENLLAGRLEFAWICGYPYIRYRDRLALTAVPVYRAQPTYRAYLIVPARDESTKDIADLRKGVFAYADPDSNSGYLVPRFDLHERGLDSSTFFRKTFFTAGHRNAIEAVSTGLADGAYVDGYVWDTLARFSPEITGRTRVVTRSQPYGFPPIVAGPAATKLNQQMQRVLVAMGDTAAAQPLLDRLNLDGFAAPQTGAYDDIAAMAEALGEVRHAP